MTPYAAIPEISNAVELMRHSFRPDAPLRRESDVITSVWTALLETAAFADHMRGFTAASERWHQMAATAMQARQNASNPSDQARLTELARQATHHAHRLTAPHARAAEHAQPYATPQDLMQHDLHVLHLYRSWRRTPTARSEWTQSRSLVSEQRHGVTGRTRDRHDLSDIHQRTVLLADASHALVMLLGTNNYSSKSDQEALQHLTEAATLHAARLALSTRDDALSRQFPAAVRLDPTYLATFERALAYIPLHNDYPIEPPPSRYPLEVSLVAQLLAYPDQIPSAAELLHDNPAIRDPLLRAVYFAALEFTPRTAMIWEAVSMETGLPQHDLNDVKAALDQAAAAPSDEGTQLVEAVLQLESAVTHDLITGYPSITPTANPTTTASAPVDPAPSPSRDHPTAYSPPERGPSPPRSGLSM